MNTGPSNNASDTPYRSSTAMRIFKFILGLLVVLAAVGISVYWLRNRPRAKRRPPIREARLVQTMIVHANAHQATVHAMGEVVPVDEVKLVSRVNGQLTRVNPDLIPGGHLGKGERLATVDQSDYKLAVEQARSALKQAELTCEERELAIEQQASQVAQAKKNLTLEEAQREVARSEYELMSRNGKKSPQGPGMTESNPGHSENMDLPLDPTYGVLKEAITSSERQLILREPQLEAARAAFRAATAGQEQARVAHRNALAAKDQAQTALDQAQLNLDWTTIEAPFNAVVRAKHVGVGSYVSQGNPIATLVNTESYWITLSVPVNRLKWIRTPSKDRPGAPVRIHHEAAWGPDKYRMGRVKRIEPAIETTGRMARIVVEVPDPRCLTEENADKPVLMLDAYVRAEIEGTELKGVIEIPRSTLHNGDTVWVKDEDNKLDIRLVTIVATTPEMVYVSDGLASGDHLITSDIPTPVEGMELREETVEPRESK